MACVAYLWKTFTQAKCRDAGSSPAACQAIVKKDPVDGVAVRESAGKTDGQTAGESPVFWLPIPIGRESGLKIHPVRVRVPGELPIKFMSSDGGISYIPEPLEGMYETKLELQAAPRRANGSSCVEVASLMELGLVG